VDRAKAGKKLRLENTAQVGEFFLPYFYGAREEKVYVAFLDEHFRLLACREVFQGGLSYAPVNVRKLVEAALGLRASNLILAHNHPTGHAIPSQEDRDSTLLISRALEAVQLRLLDHIIVAEDEYVSMEECGYFK
jgi:DNA repair protein RadC